MSTPPPSLLLNRVIRYLLPFFLHLTPDAQTARQEVLATIAAYGARTRAELMIAAKIIAFNLSAMDVLCEAKVDADLSPLLRLRLRGCARNLDQAANANEKALDRRLRCDQLTQDEAPLDLTLTVTEEETEAFVQSFQPETETAPGTANRLANGPHNSSDPGSAGRKGSAMFDALFQEVQRQAPPPAV